MIRCFSIRLLALLLVWQMTPGTSELLENVVHVVREGHLAHALPDADHQAESAEHNCSGPYHFCPCHTATSFVLTEKIAALVVPETQSRSLHRDESSARSGHPEQVFRPPISA